MNNATTASTPINASSGTVVIIFSWPEKSERSQIHAKTTTPTASNTQTSPRRARPMKTRRDMKGIIRPLDASPHSLRN